MYQRYNVVIKEWKNAERRIHADGQKIRFEVMSPYCNNGPDCSICRSRVASVQAALTGKKIDGGLDPVYGILELHLPTSETDVCEYIGNLLGLTLGSR